MSQKLNHHFVPQYHFRLFNRGERYIHLASRDGTRLIRYASVKGQCARHKFYGDERLETWLSALESRHAMVYKRVLELAWSSRWSSSKTPLLAEDHSHLHEAILLQRNRTPRAARMLASSMDQMVLHTFREYLEATPAGNERDAAIRAIDSGKATLRDSQFASLLAGLEIGMHAVRSISDLSLLVLRNHTQFPFLLGDSPSVFSNHYLRHVRGRGVLGLFSPGLMIALPVDARTAVLLYDSNVYTPDYSIDGHVEVVSKADVSQLNALQIHASERNIYFAELSCEQYVQELLCAHRGILQTQQGDFQVRGPGSLLIAGVPNSHEVLQVYEPQLPVTLDLSFIKTAPAPATIKHRRDSIPADLVESLEPKGDLRPIAMDNFAKWVESQIIAS